MLFNMKQKAQLFDFSPCLHVHVHVHIWICIFHINIIRDVLFFNKFRSYWQKIGISAQFFWKNDVLEYKGIKLRTHTIKLLMVAIGWRLNKRTIIKKINLVLGWMGWQWTLYSFYEDLWRDRNRKDLHVISIDL